MRDLDRLVIQKLYQKRILITGGTGFLGQYLVALLKALNERFTLQLELIVLTRQSIKGDSCLKYIQGDVGSFEYDGKLDYICHLATSANPRDYHDHPEQMVETIIDGAANIAQIAEDKKVARLLFMSSGAVYGPKNRFDQRIRETWELEPESLYGRAKARAERICLNHDVDVVVARGFAFYADNQPVSWGFAVADMVHEAKTKGHITVRNQTTYRSFLHAKDGALAMLYLLLGHLEYSIYNLGGSTKLSTPELAHRLAKRLDVPVIIGEGAQHNYYVPDVSRLKRAFGWEETITM